MAITFVFAIAAFGFVAQHTENNSGKLLTTEVCDTEESCFEGGEQLVYKVYYNWNFIWLSAGEVTFDVKDFGNAFEMSAVGKTYPSYEWFYTVDDYYYSFVDKETMLPKRFTRDIKEGTYSLYDKVKFDQSSNTGVSLRGKTKETAALHEFETTDCVQDLLSILYFVRNKNFNTMSEGDAFPVNLYLDLETYPLEVTLAERVRNKKIKGLGNFDVMNLNPDLIEGHVFDEGDQMNIWVSDDENKIPLMIESPLVVGSVKAILKSHRGLKFELQESE